MNKVYLDNAATTPLLDEVVAEMVFVMKNYYANPSSTHSLGQEAKTVIENVRRKIAKHFRVTPGEIIFTSGGTESNNMIIKSCVQHLNVERIITSKMEHKCVSETCLELIRCKNTEVIYLKNNGKGDLDLDELETLLKNSDKKTLVTLIHGNNEIGNILDLKKVAEICKRYNALFHSDTVQTVAHLDLDFSQIRVDFASCSGHKFHAPKGIGFAFIRKSSGLKSLINGGSQERGFRAGTENIYGIAGLGKALDLAIENLEKNANYIQDIKNYTISELRNNIKDIRFNGRSDEEKNSLYTVLNLSVPIKHPMIGLQLDMRGIAISQGSACSSGAVKVSEVIQSIHSEMDMETTTPLRVSFSHLTKKIEIDQFVSALKEIIENNNK